MILKKSLALMMMFLLVFSIFVVADDAVLAEDTVEEVIVENCGFFCTAGKWLFGDAEARALIGTAWFDRTDGLPLATGMPVYIANVLSGSDKVIHQIKCDTTTGTCQIADINSDGALGEWKNCPQCFPTNEGYTSPAQVNKFLFGEHGYNVQGMEAPSSKVTTNTGAASTPNVEQEEPNIIENVALNTQFENEQQAQLSGYEYSGSGYDKFGRFYTTYEGKINSLSPNKVDLSTSPELKEEQAIAMGLKWDADVPQNVNGQLITLKINGESGSVSKYVGLTPIVFSTTSTTTFRENEREARGITFNSWNNVEGKIFFVNSKGVITTPIETQPSTFNFVSSDKKIPISKLKAMGGEMVSTSNNQDYVKFPDGSYVAVDGTNGDVAITKGTFKVAVTKGAQLTSSELELVGLDSGATSQRYDAGNSVVQLESVEGGKYKVTLIPYPAQDGVINSDLQATLGINNLAVGDTSAAIGGYTYTRGEDNKFTVKKVASTTKSTSGPSKPSTPKTQSYKMIGRIIQILENGEDTGTTYEPVKNAELTDGTAKLPVYEWNKDGTAKKEFYVAVGTELLEVKDFDGEWKFVDSEGKETDEKGARRSSVVRKGKVTLTIKDGAAIAPVTAAAAAATDNKAAAPKVVIPPQIKEAQAANKEILQGQVLSLLGHDMYQKYGKQIEAGEIVMGNAPSELTTGTANSEVKWTKTENGLYEGTKTAEDSESKIIGAYNPATGAIQAGKDSYALSEGTVQPTGYTVKFGESTMVISEPLKNGQVVATLDIKTTEDGKTVVDEKNSVEILLSGERTKKVLDKKGRPQDVQTRGAVFAQSVEQKNAGIVAIGDETFYVDSNTVIDDLKAEKAVEFFERVPTEKKTDDGKPYTDYKRGRSFGKIEYDSESDQETETRYDTKVETTHIHKTGEKILFDLDGTKYEGKTLKRNEGILYGADGKPTHILGTDGKDITLVDINTGLSAGVITTIGEYGQVQMIQTGFNEMQMKDDKGTLLGTFTEENGVWLNDKKQNPDTVLYNNKNPPVALTEPQKQALVADTAISKVNQQLKDGQRDAKLALSGADANSIQELELLAAEHYQTQQNLDKQVKKAEINIEKIKYMLDNPDKEPLHYEGGSKDGQVLTVKDAERELRNEEIVLAKKLEEKRVAATAEEEAKVKIVEAKKAQKELSEMPYTGLGPNWGEITDPKIQGRLIGAIAGTPNTGTYLAKNGLLKSVGTYKDSNNNDVELFTDSHGDIYLGSGAHLVDNILTNNLANSWGDQETWNSFNDKKAEANVATAAHLEGIQKKIEEAKAAKAKEEQINTPGDANDKMKDAEQSDFGRGLQVGVDSIYALTSELSKTYSSLNQLWQDEQWYKDWTGKFDTAIAPLLGSNAIPSAICEGDYDIEPEGTAMIKTVSGTYQAIAHIEGEVTPDTSPILCSRNPDAEADEEWICGKGQVCVEDNFCYEDANGDKEPDNDNILKGYFYKITWAVSAPRDETFTPYKDENGVAVSFNVVLYNGKSELKLYKRGGDSVGPMELNNGERDSDVLTKFSANPYTDVCIVWEHAPSSVEIKKKVGDAVHGTGTIDDVCFKIVKSTVGKVTWQKSSKTSNSHKVSSGDAEIEVVEDW